MVVELDSIKSADGFEVESVILAGLPRPCYRKLESSSWLGCCKGFVIDGSSFKYF